ncbi:MAG: hypothetical protein HOL04_05110 [Gammaproteobacteria bacterium]|jgi:predicted PurR-regulated permease PerM|nr:hypothetical protein [Gammaproteobacteria bacterium]MBT4811193.1 hypothetical protein [Thiotrichales bacterium]MBT3472245.1 hypothetical protein [Gammaproteobacteria bacterium]MBT4079481.1 hypothetical protein [Gammaproteobacteria bacterium]MBT4330955.1 hypothetical protein [Gammaproteobacteria bacterium]
MRIIYLAPSILFLLLTAFSVEAVEVAPRISDREIIESLAEIKGELKAINQRFEAIDQRFEVIDQRFDDMNISIDQRFDDMNTSINQRFSSLESTMLTLFSALIMLMVALFGYIAWDRRTALKPLEREVQELKYDLERDLGLRHPDGTVLTRLVDTLRELAKKDHELAGVLRSFSLL